MRTASSVLIGLMMAALGGAETPLPTSWQTLDDPLETFSISHPPNWRATRYSEGDWSEVGLFGETPHDISIVVTSRPLPEGEVKLDRTALKDQLIERTLTNLGALGHEVVHIGLVDELVEGWPAFAAVATDRDRSKMMTLLRSAVDGRVYAVATLTDNLQGSPELGALVSRVVATLQIGRP